MFEGTISFSVVGAASKTKCTTEGVKETFMKHEKGQKTGERGERERRRE